MPSGHSMEGLPGVVSSQRRADFYLQAARRCHRDVKTSSAPASRTMRLTLLATSTARNCPEVVPFARGGTAL